MCDCTGTFLTTCHGYIDWPVLQCHMYVDHLLWPKAFLPFGYDYDKSEVKKNVFHCLWWQETKLFAQMSLSNGDLTGSTLLLSVPPSKANQTWAYSIGLETTFSVPFAALLSFPPCESVVLTVRMLGRIKNPVTSTSQRHSYMLSDKAPPSPPGCLLKPFKLNPLHIR